MTYRTVPLLALALLTSGCHRKHAEQTTPPAMEDTAPMNAVPGNEMGNAFVPPAEMNTSTPANASEANSAAMANDVAPK